MKRLIAILFLSAYFFSTTELAQLLKIPILISHFIEHKQHDENMSFLEFLTHHYGGHQKDADWNTDMKLPFMQHSDTLHVVVVPPGTPVTFHKEAVLVCSDTQLALYKDRAIPFAGQKGIWQPPKSC